MANNVEIIIPVPADADSPHFKVISACLWPAQVELSQAQTGKVEYVPEKECCVWRIKQFQGSTT